MLYSVITIVIIIVCILLSIVVLIQNPKGGGLNASISGVGQQLLGARRSTDVVEKMTWGFAAAFIVLCIFTSLAIDKRATTKKEVVPTKMEQMNKTAPMPMQQQPQGGNQGGTTPQ